MRSGIKDGSTVYLVSCVGGKFPKPTIAKDLYTSAWFKKARHFVESKSCPWFVLSAEFGLMSPERIDLAEPLYKRAIAILDSAFGESHPDTILYRKNLARMKADRETAGK